MLPFCLIIYSAYPHTSTTHNDLLQKMPVLSLGLMFFESLTNPLLLLLHMDSDWLESTYECVGTASATLNFHCISWSDPHNLDLSFEIRPWMSMVASTNHSRRVEVVRYRRQRLYSSVDKELRCIPADSERAFFAVYKQCSEQIAKSSRVDMLPQRGLRIPKAEACYVWAR